ncbi:MAG: tetratricopeptide repeat protein, partial [Candidatus Aminicenantes bacterium]|nr:tetratricopeptide repeat protein [Candidatus Aminicenantes bacterium]
MINSKKIIATIPLGFFLIFSLINNNLFPSKKTDAKQEYSQLFNQAENLRADGEFDDSIELFKKTLNIAKKVQNEINICDSLPKLGLLYWNIGNLEESSVYYKQALEVAEKLNLKFKLERCKNALEIYRLYKEGKKFRDETKEYQKSIESFEKAINLARTIRSKEHELKCIRQLSFVYFELNNFKEFHSLNENALKLAKSLNHRKSEGRCLNNIGVHFWKFTNYSKALTCFKNAAVIAEKLNNKKDKRKYLNNIGLIYLEIGSYDKAIDYLDKALSIYKQSGDEISTSHNLNNFGVAYRRKGILSGDEKDFKKALEYYYECLKFTRRTKDRKTEVLVTNNIGSVNSELGKYDKALEYFQAGLKKAEEIQDFEMMGMILTNIGVVHYNQGNYAESTKYYEQAIDLAIGRDQILWEVYMESARAYEKQKDYKKALEFYKESIKTTEDIRSTIDLEELKAKFLGTDKRIDAYHYLINLLANPSEFHPTEENKLEAFNYLEKAKARAFLDSLELSKVDLSEGVDLELLNREKEIMKDISQVHTKLLAAEPSPEAKKVLKEDLKKLENDLETLKREMRQKSPAYADIQYP